MADERFSNLEVLNGHRSLFSVIRTLRETSALRTTSKSSNLRRVYLTFGYTDDVYLNLMFLALARFF